MIRYEINDLCKMANLYSKNLIVEVDGLDVVCKFSNEYVNVLARNNTKVSITHKFNVDLYEVGKVLMWKPDLNKRKDGAIYFLNFNGQIISKKYDIDKNIGLYRDSFDESLQITIPYNSEKQLSEMYGIKSALEKAGIQVEVKEYTK